MYACCVAVVAVLLACCTLDSDSEGAAAASAAADSGGRDCAFAGVGGGAPGTGLGRHGDARLLTP